MPKKQIESLFFNKQGLDSAREGAKHWWRQRVTAVALVPLTLWFAASLVARAGSDYDAFILWLRAPFTTILMVMLLIALFYHMALGLQVVIEDYIHTDRIKILTLKVIYLVCFLLAAAGIVATLHIAFNG